MVEPGAPPYGPVTEEVFLQAQNSVTSEPSLALVHKHVELLN